MSAPLVLYDGLCGFCDASVQWLLDHDRGVFRFAPLQGETGAAILARHPDLPDGIDSIVLIDENDGIRWHSAAVFGICAHLPRPWSAAAWFGVLPRPLTDLAYRVFARFRYRVWGRREACRVPTPGERARFLP